MHNNDFLSSINLGYLTFLSIFECLSNHLILCHHFACLIQVVIIQAMALVYSAKIKN